MREYKRTEEHVCNSEIEAKEAIEGFRDDARNNGYLLSHAGFTYKCKKSKGEIIDECWVVKIVKEISPLWGEE